MRAVTVYCSSSSRVAQRYFDAAEAAGRAIAREGWTLVYGGNVVGMMKTLADSCRAGGGRVVGITPQLMLDKGIGDEKADELVVTTSMRQRKGLMEERGDGFLTLPGGLGTLEEIFEIIVGKQLKYHNKPIVILNTQGFYAPLLAMIDHGVEQGFIKSSVRKLFHVAADVEDAMAHFRSYQPTSIADKWDKGAESPAAQ